MAQTHVGKIRSYYEPIVAEYEVLSGKRVPDDLKEGYSNLSKKDVKNSLAWLQALMSDLNSYESTKKASRKRRVAKPVSASKIVAKLKYKKDDTAFKISSIDPINIVDSTVLYVFNTKYKTFGVYKTDGSLTVKGSTIQQFDEKESFVITLRKPEDILPQILKTTERKIDKLLDGLTTKRQKATGRINGDTVILRAIK